MANSILRWGLFLLALLVVGPLAHALISGITAADGSRHVSAFVNAAPFTGILRALGCLILATATGMLSARLVSLNVGLLNLGVVLAWTAAGLGTMDEILRATQAANRAWLMGLEGGVFGFLAAGAACMVAAANHKRLALSSPTPPTPEPSTSRADHAVAFACIFAAGFVAAWAVAQNMLKGQAIATGAATAIIGTIAATVIVRRAHPAVVATGLMALAIVGPIMGVLLHGSSGSGGMVARATAGTLINIARMTPFDWLAGGLIGMPIGRSLSGWLGEMHVRPEPKPAS
ncbi:MAG: hypothetical protein ACT4PL_13335 [Phycisphaerales bacterium]